jgi:hypothetical protein
VSGGITETIFGASAATVLVKITVWLAAIFMGSTLLLATLTGRVRGGKSVAETYIPATTEAATPVQPIDIVPAVEGTPATAAEQAVVTEEAIPAAEQVKAEAEKAEVPASTKSE